MSYTSYREMLDRLNMLAPIHGHSVTAMETRNAGHSRRDERSIYTVTSYATLIAQSWMADNNNDGLRLVKWINDEHYSSTTSRIQNLCKIWLPGERVKFGEPDEHGIRPLLDYYEGS